MGVIGLQSFAEVECKTVVCPVSIEDAAEHYRRRTGRTPLLVVDTSASMTHIYKKAVQFPMFGCGQLKECVHAFIEMLKTLKERDIECVLFFDGSPPDDRIDLYANRRNKELKKKNEIMACLSRGEDPVGLEHYPLRHVEIYLLSQLKAAQISFIKTVREADDEIMEFIAEHGCFGVLSQDSDFLIAEGIPNYFSAEHLNLRTLRTVIYRRENLAKELGLAPWLLPYFATLCGNDVVTRAMLRQFHLGLLAHLPNVYQLEAREFLPKTFLFPEVVKWMKKHLRDYWRPHDLPEVAAAQSGCSHLAHLFRRSVNSYRLPAVNKHTDLVHAVENCPWNNILCAADSLVRKGVIQEAVRNVLVRCCLFSSGDLQFYDNPDYPCDVVLLKTLRQRFYGILLKERPRHMGPPQVKEMMLQGQGTLDNFDVVDSVLPAEHPGLLTLWSASCPVEPKWRLLCWAVSPDLDPEEVLALPAPLRVPAMALYYLNNASTFLRQWQVEALALQAVELQTATLADVRDAHCQPPGPVAIHIAAVYLNACHFIYIVSGACGNPTALFQHPEFVHFDGKMFHRAYQAIQEGTSALSLCRHRIQVSDCFRQVMSFLWKKKPVVVAAAPAPNPPERPAKKDVVTVTDLQKALTNLRF